MSFSEKYIPLQGVNVDLSPSLLPANMARFIKNLVYSIEDSSSAGDGNMGNSGVLKTYQSTKEYDTSFSLPDGENKCIGSLSSKETNQVFFWVYNSNGNHTCNMIDGSLKKVFTLKMGAYLNYQLNPEFFMHEGAASVFFTFVDDGSGNKKRRTFLAYTDGFNPQRYFCIEDALETNGFSDFVDPNIFSLAGVAPPVDCIQIEDEFTESKNANKLLFNGWQFRARYFDMWGKPSEYGVISDMYLPGINDCLSSANNVPNCLKLKMPYPPENIDKVEIAYRKNNENIWYTSDVLDLYVGGITNEWWNRVRNDKIEVVGGQLVYTFCNDRECKPISSNLTSRIENPLPRTSVGASNIGGSLSLYNNKYGFNKLPKSITDGISVSVSVNQSTSLPESRKITIYIPIYNWGRDYFETVYEDDQGFAFGANHSATGGSRAYDQYFKRTGQKSFRGYLVGGPSATGQQVYITNEGSIIDDVSFNGLSVSQVRYNDSGYTMQKFVFENIAPGNYTFRLESHLSDDSEPNPRQTSTTVYGVFPLRSGNYIPNIDIEYIGKRYELNINVCDSDYDTLSSGYMMVVADNSVYRGATLGGNRVVSKMVYGYVKESPSTNISVEGVLVYESGFGTPGFKTDHNGFYYIPRQNSNSGWEFEGKFLFLNFNFTYRCTVVSVPNPVEIGNNSSKRQDFFLSNFEQKYSDFSDIGNNRIVIKGRLVSEIQNIGIPNATVYISEGQSSTTDSSGVFSLIIHDTNEIRTLNISGGACVLYDKNGGCLSPILINGTSMNNCYTVGFDGEWEIDMGDIFLTSSFGGRGLLSGGTYAIGVAGKDWLDRTQFVQDLGYVTIPSFHDTKNFSPATIGISIGDSVLFPTEFDRLNFYISEETTIQNYLTWITDEVEFVDNSGNKNDSNPTQIKIWIRSIIEYNKQNNYNTTVNWGFTDINTDTPQLRDNILFLINGDGVPFDFPIIRQVKYSDNGEYILVDYTNELKDLKRNSFIRLYRNRDCVTEGAMFELCNSVKLNNGIPDVKQFTLNAYDTYYVNREIPVPVGEEEPVNESRFFAFPFEHNSPSDSWGLGIKNIGRVNFKNPHESVIYKQNEIALSGGFSENGLINYHNFFEENLKFSFTKNSLNGIISIVHRPGVVLVIGQNNNFVIGYDDNTVRVNQDGTLRIPSASELFGRPNPNPHTPFGCNILDKNSIASIDGYAHWLDRTNATVVQHNFQNGLDLCFNVCSSYFRQKIKSVQSSGRYFIGICNPINREYVISDKKISGNYVNNERYYNVDVEETNVFDILSRSYKGHVGYLPEFYSKLEGEIGDQQMYGFLNGVPFCFYSSLNENGFGEFFGQQIERVLSVVANTDNFKKKKLLSTSVYSDNLYWVDDVKTEAGHRSWIPVVYWNKGNGFWSAPFLCSGNIVDGDMMYGTWAEVRYIGHNEDNKKETQLQGVTISFFPEEESGTKQ